jgi:MFS family permease
VHDWWSFLAASVPVAVTEQSAPPLIMALVGGLVRPDLRTRVMAVHRSVINLGISIGGLSAGPLLGNAAAHIFTLLFIADAVAFAGAATLWLRVEDRRVERVRRGSVRRAALRDKRLLSLIAFDAMMSLWQPILNVASPLWLMTRTGPGPPGRHPRCSRVDFQLLEFRRPER